MIKCPPVYFKTKLTSSFFFFIYTKNYFEIPGNFVTGTFISCCRPTNLTAVQAHCSRYIKIRYRPDRSRNTVPNREHFIGNHRKPAAVGMVVVGVFPTPTSSVRTPSSSSSKMAIAYLVHWTCVRRVCFFVVFSSVRPTRIVHGIRPLISDHYCCKRRGVRSAIRVDVFRHTVFVGSRLMSSLQFIVHPAPGTDDQLNDR